MKSEVNRLREDICLSQPPPPQYEFAAMTITARPPPVSPPCSLSLPYAEPESSGDNQIEIDYLETLTDGQEQERRETPLIRVQGLREEGVVVLKREYPKLESTLAGMGLVKPRQLHLKMQQATFDDFSLADGASRELEGAFYRQATFGVIPEKITSQVTARQAFMSLPTSRQQQRRYNRAADNTVRSRRMMGLLNARQAAVMLSIFLAGGRVSVCLLFLVRLLRTIFCIFVFLFFSDARYDI